MVSGEVNEDLEEEVAEVEQEGGRRQGVLFASALMSEGEGGFGGRERCGSTRG